MGDVEHGKVEIEHGKVEAEHGKVGQDEVAQAEAEQSARVDDSSETRSQRPQSEAFRQFIASGWAEIIDRLPAASAASAFTPARREALSAAFPGERLIVPAGGLRVRSNDTDYRFRAHSAFAHLTGLGSEAEPDSVLVLHPMEPGADDSRDASPDGAGPKHRAVLYIWPRAGRDTEEFYASARYGELWVGARPSLAEVEALTGIECAHLQDLEEAIGKDADEVAIRVVPGAADEITALVDAQRVPHDHTDADRDEKGLFPEQVADAELAQFLSELRLIKDEFEIDELRKAVAASAEGFADIVRALPEAVAHERGERVIETVFERVARRSGNGIGYDTIAAAGEHACTLHWIHNDGVVPADELVLIDAGVEVDSLYTADVTRTLPVSGHFSDEQRQVYEAVLAAADAAFEVARPGSKFRDVHNAAMLVIATTLHEWGLLPVSVEEALDPDKGGQHRRWMVHGTSHHLGIDVHDCAQARRDMYLDAELRPGMVFTIEPGLYFKSDDLLVPAPLRGIGVRIEDDVLVTESGCENLTAALPRASHDVEAWMASLSSGGHQA